MHSDNTVAQEGQLQVPSSCNSMPGGPSSTRLGCSGWHWKRQGLLAI